MPDDLEGSHRQGPDRQEADRKEPGRATADRETAAVDASFALIREAPFGVYLVDADFRLAQVSSGARKVFANVHPLLGRDLAEVLRIVWPEPFASEAIARFRHTLETGEPFHSPDTTEPRGDIEEVESYDWQIVRVTMPDGRPAVVCYFYELTDLWRAQERLRASDRQARLAVDLARLGTWRLDIATETAELDPRMREILGVGRDVERVSLPSIMERMVPDDRDRVTAALRAATDPAGDGSFSVEAPVTWLDGSTHWVAARGQAAFATVTGERRAVELHGTALDVTSGKRAQEQLRASADRAMFRATIADIVRPLTDPDAIRREASRLLGRHLGASRVHACEMLPDGEQLAVGEGYVAGVSPLPDRFALAELGPSVAERLRAGATVVIGDVAADPSTAGAVRRYADRSVSAIVAVPRVRDQIVGLLLVQHAEPRAWHDGEVALIEETAERVWAAVERGRIETELREREARYRSLFTSIDEGFCLCEMIVDGAGRPVDYRFLEVNERFEEQTGLVDPVGRTAKELVPELEERWIVAYARVGLGGETLRFEQGSDVMGRWFDVYASPVEPVGGGRFALVFSDVTERRHAVEVLRQKEETERRTATQLQRALLPRLGALHAHLPFAARYEPGSEQLEIGGDWYDAFPLPGGQIGLVVGDVMGHGLDAAVAMGRLQIALKALALQSTGPAEAIARLDAFVEGDTHGDDGVGFATVFYGIVDPDSGDLRYATAGHLPPLVASATGPTRWLDDGRSPPILGTTAHARLESTTSLHDGDVLILYSDGLVERRGEHIGEGLDRLARAGSALGDAPVDEACDRLLRSVGGVSAHDDDIVVVCARFAPLAAPTFARTFQATPGDLRAIRRACRAWLARVGVSPERHDDVLAVISEASANAIEHAYRDVRVGGIAIELRLDDEETLLVEIRDFGTWRDGPSVSGRGRGSAIMRGLSDDWTRTPDDGGTIVRSTFRGVLAARTS